MIAAPRLLLLVMVLALSACVQTEPPSQKALSQIRSFQKSVVLMRIVVEDGKGQTIPAFSSDLTFGNLRLGLGQLRGGGMPSSTLGSLRFLSGESRRDGWVYMVLRPARYYLYVYSQHDLPKYIRAKAMWYELAKRMPRWSFEVPPRAQTVYVGSLYVTGRRLDAFLASEDTIHGVDASAARVVKGENAARELLVKFLPRLDAVQTTLMARHTSNTFRF